MNALNNYIKQNQTKDLNDLKRGINNKNYFNKNKYFFNEIYKNKTLPKDDLISIVNQIINDESEEDKDIKLKNIAREFVRDHHELFPDNENVIENNDQNHVENHDENVTKVDRKCGFSAIFIFSYFPFCAFCDASIFRAFQFSE